VSRACDQCREEKPIDAFHRKGKFHLRVCKECTRGHIESKVCSKCHVEKNVSEFGKTEDSRDGYRYYCNECQRQEWVINREAISARRREVLRQNPEEGKRKAREYYQKNREEMKKRRQENLVNIRVKEAAYAREYYKKNKDKVVAKNHKWVDAHKEQDLTRRRKYNQENKGYFLEYVRERRKTDLDFKLRSVLRCRLRLALKGIAKSAHTMELVGCTTAKLKTHLGIQFRDGMSWENYGGKTGWQIDHIIPCASFDLSKPEEQRGCFHYTNLQPLWAADNMRKGTKTEQRKVA